MGEIEIVIPVETAMVRVLTSTDNAVDQIKHALDGYVAKNPGAEVEIDRSEWGTINLHVIAEKFKGWSLAERHDDVAAVFDDLTDDSFSQIGVLRCSTPAEIASAQS